MAPPATPVVESGPLGPPQFRFGVISDVQHARVDDGKSYHGTSRYYRNGLKLLNQAVQDWQQNDISFVLQMGDILDGSQPRDASLEVLASVLAELEVLGTAGIPTYHTLGNHCLYNLQRHLLNQALGISQHAPKDQPYPTEGVSHVTGLLPEQQPTHHLVTALSQQLDSLSPTVSVSTSVELLQYAIADCSLEDCSVSTAPTLLTSSSGDDSTPGSSAPVRSPAQSLTPSPELPAFDAVSYYSFAHTPGGCIGSWRVIMLDGYDVSMLGWPAEHPHTRAAAALLQLRNPHNPNKNSAEGLTGLDRRFVAFTGGIGNRQLAWLEQELAAATACSQRVIVCSHLPFLPSTCPPACLQWDYRQVLDLLQACPAVKLTLAGHSHQNGYAVDDSGIHHVVLHGVVETAPGNTCHGRVDVYDDLMLLHGEGMVESRVMFLRPDGKATVAAAAGVAVL
ncbi:MAG: hypothetical protein WDW38_002922 [Sanguina aurantia]